MATTSLISRSHAVEQLFAQTFDWGLETVPLAKAAARVLREPIYPDRPQPPFDRVMMDGVAIHYPSYLSGQRFFPVDRLQAAGMAPAPLQQLDHCREIMTGAALPTAATTVVPYEEIQATAGGFLLGEGVQDGKNIHRSGSDLPPNIPLRDEVKAGKTPPHAKALLASGQPIGIAAIGMLATFGYYEVQVAALPKTLIISTGDELVGIDESPLAYQIRRSNIYQLAQLLRPFGIQAELLHLPDEPHQMRQQLLPLLPQFDLVLVSGGVSKGKKDYVPELLTQAGVQALFHGVAQRPGKPLWVGRHERTMVFGLPGNPVSSLVCALGYVLPFIRRNLPCPIPTAYAVLGSDHHFSPPLTQFLAVSLHNDPQTGLAVALPVQNQGSGDSSSLLTTQGFLILPAEQSSFLAGSVFPFLPLE